MKTKLTAILLFASLGVFAQSPSERPRTEFSIQLSESTLLLKPGETKQVTVSIARSKSFSKGKVLLGSSSVLPKGITVAFEPADGDFETSVAKITVDESVESKTYQLVVNGTMHHKTKGTILKLEVTTESMAAK